MPVLERRNLLALSSGDAMSLVKQSFLVGEELLAAVEAKKRLGALMAAMPSLDQLQQETLDEINRPHVEIETTLRGQIAALLVGNSALESENRTLRAQLTVHRAGSRYTEVNVETLAGADLDRLALRYGFGSLRPARFSGETDAEFRERVLDVVWNRIAAKPEDPRSAALARAMADRLPGDTRGEPCSPLRS